MYESLGKSRWKARAIFVALLALASAGLFAASAQAATPRPQNVTLSKGPNNFGNGNANMTLTWDAPASATPDHYDVQICPLPPDTAVTTCRDTNGSGWQPIVTTTGHTSTMLCPAQSVTCYMRVRSAFNPSDTVVSDFVTKNHQPWAPFHVSAFSGPGSGQITVGYHGPTESGTGPDKHYVLYTCDSDVFNCSNTSNWAKADRAPYPPTDPMTKAVPCPSGHFCFVRMAFADDTSETLVSMLSARTGADGA